MAGAALERAVFSMSYYTAESVAPKAISPRESACLECCRVGQLHRTSPTRLQLVVKTIRFGLSGASVALRRSSNLRDIWCLRDEVYVERENALVCQEVRRPRRLSSFEAFDDAVLPSPVPVTPRFLRGWAQHLCTALELYLAPLWSSGFIANSVRVRGASASTGVSFPL